MTDHTVRSFLPVLIVSSLATVLGCGSAHRDLTEPAARGASASTEPTFTAAAISPLAKETPLQVVSFFPREPSETLTAPATDLAELIATARAEAGFGRRPLETLLLDPAPPSIKGRKLLYIALGPRSEISLERIKAVGATAMREAISMGVPSMAFAPVVRDQGVTTYGADEVAAAFIEGALVEYRDERRARPGQLVALQDVTYEAGAQYVDSVARAVARGVDAAHRRPTPAASR